MVLRDSFSRSKTFYHMVLAISVLILPSYGKWSSLPPLCLCDKVLVTLSAPGPMISLTFLSGQHLSYLSPILTHVVDLAHLSADCLPWPQWRPQYHYNKAAPMLSLPGQCCMFLHLRISRGSKRRTGENLVKVTEERAKRAEVLWEGARTGQWKPCPPQGL